MKTTSVLMAGVVLPVMVLLWWELDNGDSREASDNSQKVAACVQRGIAYYKKIGSYPLLKSAPYPGPTVDDVVRERCNRTTTAF